MGWALGWLAINGKSMAAIQQELGLHPTGAKGDLFDFTRLDRRLLGRTLPSGWHLLVSRNCDHPMLTDRNMAAISSGCDAVRCAVEEHVMFSVAALWHHGAMAWLVEHENERGERDLRVLGTPPQYYDAVLARVTAESDAAADDQTDFFFDVPLLLAQNTVGFRHDEASAPQTTEFDWLEPDESGPPTPTKPWWRFW